MNLEHVHQRAQVRQVNQNKLVQLATLAGDRDYAGATWYTDGSLLEGKAGGAAVWILRGAVKERREVLRFGFCVAWSRKG
jgi:hypothetical protein